MAIWLSTGSLEVASSFLSQWQVWGSEEGTKGHPDNLCSNQFSHHCHFKPSWVSLDPGPCYVFITLTCELESTCLSSEDPERASLFLDTGGKQNTRDWGGLMSSFREKQKSRMDPAKASLSYISAAKLQILLVSLLCVLEKYVCSQFWYLVWRINHVTSTIWSTL